MHQFLVDLGFSQDIIAALRLDTLGRLVLAAILGGAVGTERELSGKPAGLRTNLLICLGAALIAEFSRAVATEISGDPARLAAQVVSGIGFIGAGTIIQSRGRVVGLTTAATLWVVAAIGLAVGLGKNVEAIGSAIFVVGSLFGLRRLERAFSHRWVKRRYVLHLDNDHPVEEILTALGGFGLRPQVEGIDRHPGDLELLLRLDGPSKHHEALMPHLATLPGLRRAQRL